MPDFKAIHQRNASKQESIDDYAKRISAKKVANSFLNSATKTYSHQHLATTPMPDVSAEKLHSEKSTSVDSVKKRMCVFKSNVRNEQTKTCFRKNKEAHLKHRKTMTETAKNELDVVRRDLFGAELE